MGSRSVLVKYNNLKLTWKLIAGYTGYHRKKTVVLTREIVSALDNIKMSETMDQSHVDQNMAKIFQLEETNNILGEQIKKNYETIAILARQGQEEKNPGKENKSYPKNWI